jgi:hypothetical protein
MATDGKTKLRGLFDGIVGAAADLSSLEVLTLSGDITKILDKTTTAGQPDKFEFKKRDALMSLIGNPTEDVKGKVFVVAYTKIEIDQDTINFVRENLTEEDKKIYQLHLDSVKAAQEARAAFIHMLTEIF